MPHLVIEHSPEITDAMPALCQAVFEAACRCSTFPNPSAVKVRSRLCQNHTGGTGAGFAHTTVRMLEGRSDDLKSEVTAAVLAAMETALPTTASLTVEVVDLHTASYAKRYL
ncbi:MAG: 5-carboxymethyl-2-hydroxymuconate Delta-isomerase [Planktomarina sp.]